MGQPMSDIIAPAETVVVPVHPTYASRAQHSFTFIINSLSSTAQNSGIYVDSPHFRTPDGGVWAIRLYPFGVNYFCSLLRMHDRAPLVLRYDVDFLPRIGDGPPSYSVKAEPFTYGHLLPVPHEIVSLDRATSDFLVLQFRLKKSRRQVPRRLLVMSEIQVERSSSVYSCSFEEAVGADNGDQNIIENERNFLNGRFSNLEEGASHEIFPMKIQCSGLGYVDLALNRSRTKHCGLSRIHMLDIQGKVRASSGAGEHFFRTDSVDLFRYHNLMTVAQMKRDEEILCREGQLVFIFDIETSHGFPSVNRKKTSNGPCRKIQNSLQDDMMKFSLALKKPDLRIRVGEEVFRAHKAIVSARSPVFKTMLKANMLEKESGVVNIEGVDPVTFRRLMRFIYTSAFDRDMNGEDIVNLYAAADRYSIASLKRICSSFLKSYVSVGNCCCLLIFSELHQDDELKHVIEFFIFTHYEDVIYSSDWKFVKEEYPQMAEKVLERHLQRKQRFY